MLTLWRFLPFCLLFLLTTPTLDAAIDLPPDPADYTLYDCYEDERKTWNDGSVSEHDGNPVGDVEGRIYWPVVCGAPTEAPTEAKLPLVIVIHGDGHTWTTTNILWSTWRKTASLPRPSTAARRSPMWNGRKEFVPI